jgi:hypothetical protein
VEGSLGKKSSLRLMEKTYRALVEDGEVVVEV